eukprot:m.669312 g.669312  ORF g.669312 m.669312 type:complete len:145 (+) comp22761_c0_seq5:173-607(+)
MYLHRALIFVLLIGMSKAVSVASTLPDMVGGKGGLPPPWLTGDMEKPAGTRTDGSATFLYFTEEQQNRLGVDEFGAKLEKKPEGKKMMCGGMKCGGVDMRPAWQKHGISEPPAGEKDMGGYVAAVYTPEQQKRLHVDEEGNPRL